MNQPGKKEETHMKKPEIDYYRLQHLPCVCLGPETMSTMSMISKVLLHIWPTVTVQMTRPRKHTMTMAPNVLWKSPAAVSHCSLPYCDKPNSPPVAFFAKNQCHDIPQTWSFVTRIDVTSKQIEDTRTYKNHHCSKWRNYMESKSRHSL